MTRKKVLTEEVTIRLNKDTRDKLKNLGYTSYEAAINSLLKRSYMRNYMRTYNHNYKGTQYEVLERDEWKCCVCGKGLKRFFDVLLVHHKDRDRTNNSLDNLVSLCPSCHLYVHKGDLIV